MTMSEESVADVSVPERFNAPPAPHRNKPIEVSVVGRRCVYVNNYRVAGGKPYYSENLPHHELKTTLGDVLDAFHAEDIRAALTEREEYAESLRAYHERKKAATLTPRPIGEGE